MTHDSTLAELDPLLRLIARERVGTQTWLLDDAMQEARIRAWTRLEEGHSIGIAVHAAKQAVLDVVLGRRMTGSKQAGVPITRTTSLIQPSPGGEDEYLVEPADPSAETAFDRVLEDENARLRYLLEPLSDAQRSAVLGRLDGLTTREIAKREGVSHQAISLRLMKARQILGELAA